MRDKENAQDTSPTEDVMLEFINKYNFEDEDLFILVQTTSPFTKAKDFENALKLYQEKNADSLLTCARIKKFVWTNDGKPINYDYRKRPRRQDFNGILVENGAFYINKIKNIKKYRNRLSGKIAIYEMPEYTSIELDEKDDWIIAETLMRKYVLSKYNKNKKIKLFITDVDGVLTDAGMYYFEEGGEFKKFNTHDGKGIELLRETGIKTAIITSENTQIVENRAKKLKIDYVYQGIKDKLSVAKDICKKEDIALNEAAYIGDDIDDTELLQNVGLAACPANAMRPIKNISNIIYLEKRGGDGAVREFAEKILEINMEK